MTDDVETWLEMTRQHYASSNWRDCLIAAEQSIRLDPSNAEVHLMRASAFMALRQFPEAAASAQEVVLLAPDNAEVRIFHARCLMALKQFGDAIPSAQSAVQLAPNSAESQFVLGACLKREDRIDESEAPLSAAIKLNPNAYEALNDLADIHIARGDAASAVDCLRRSHEIKPFNLDAMSGLCFYTAFDQRATTADLFQINKEWSQHLNAAAKEHVHAVYPPYSETLPRADRKIRIAYLANDFFDHVTSWFLEPVLARHDRSKFHVTCYSGTERKDHVTTKLASLVDVWRDINEEDIEGTVSQIRHDDIDILILASFFRGKDRRVLAYRAAPIQVGYNNRVASTGLDTVDYIITQEVSDPKGKVDALYSESLVRITNHNTYLPPPNAPAPNAPPCLGNGFVTFGSFNNHAKINDGVVKVWSGILAAIPDSRLILRSSRYFENPTTCSFFSKRFAAYGTDPARLTFQGFRETRQDHLRDMGDADIALDPFPCSGGTTSYESLWMGLPLVSLETDTIMGRLGLYFLPKLDMADLACTTPEAYIDAAHRLANDPARIQRLRKTLRAAVELNFFNYDNHVCELESAYETMWRRRVDGAPHTPFDVCGDKVFED